MQILTPIFLILMLVYSGYKVYKRDRMMRSSSMNQIPVDSNQVYVIDRAMIAHSQTGSPVKFSKTCDAEILYTVDGHKVLKLSQQETVKAEKNILIQ